MNILNILFSIDTALAATVTGAVGKVGEDTTSEFSKMITNFLEQIPLWIVAFVVAVLSYFAAMLVRRSIENKLTQEGLEEEHREVQIMAGRGSFFIVLTLGITIALSIVGIDLKPIVAAGAFGLGFALQDIMMNLIAGMMILASRHYAIGDVITVSGITGKIEEIQTRATIIKSFDGTRAVVPNAQLFKNVVVSKTSNPYRKLSFSMGVGYGTNLKDVRNLTLAVVKAIPWVLQKPKPNVIFSSWGDSTIDFKINVWIDSKGGKFVKVKNQVIMDLTKAYEEAGIDIPWPITTLNFEQADHSEQNEKAISKKIKAMRKEFKAKSQDTSFQTIKEVLPLQPQPADQQPAYIPPENSIPVQENPVQNVLPVSPMPTVNSPGQSWLQQAYTQQLNNTEPVVSVEPVNQASPEPSPVQLNTQLNSETLPNTVQNTAAVLPQNTQMGTQENGNQMV